MGDLKESKIPEFRKSELKQTLISYFNKDDLTIQDIVMASNIDPWIENENYISHGELVVNYFAQNDGILKLERMWREHFLETMCPKFLPSNWSVEHQENRLSLRQQENRINDQ